MNTQNRDARCSARLSHSRFQDHLSIYQACLSSYERTVHTENFIQINRKG